MKRGFAIAALSAAMLLAAVSPAVGGLDSVPDTTNPRIVPLFNRFDASGPVGSGFLYSPRIILTAAHLYLEPRSDGTMRVIGGTDWYVGEPNSTTTSTSKRVRVAQKFASPLYRDNRGRVDDFAVFVLEQDLAQVPEARLMTPEIEKILTAARTTVKLHGYGIFKDACKDGEKPPCMGRVFPSTSPRSMELTIRPYSDFKELVGYERPQVSDQVTFFSPGKLGPCGGDSGGSVTTMYENELLYIAVTPNGMNAYACGQSGDWDTKGGIDYSTPVHRHLALIERAKEAVAKQRENEAAAAAAAAAASPQPTPSATPSMTPSTKPKQIVCVKGKQVKRVTGTKCPSGYRKR